LTDLAKAVRLKKSDSSETRCSIGGIAMKEAQQMGRNYLKRLCNTEQTLSIANITP
jgi:hypothetical protein